ncbi:MAG: hypothetical protein ACR2QC_06890 [Gammaproteobacteria bacterium]
MRPRSVRLARILPGENPSWRAVDFFAAGDIIAVCRKRRLIFPSSRRCRTTTAAGGLSTPAAVWGRASACWRTIISGRMCIGTPI